MKTLEKIALGALAVLLLAPCFAAAGEGPPAKWPALPFSPSEGAAAGDWAQYRVIDPSTPDERLPPERFLVKAVEGGEAIVTDSTNDDFHYKLGDEGKSVAAFLHGFFGDSRDDQLANVRTVAAEPFSGEFGGKHYEGVRIDVTLLARYTADQTGSEAGEMRSQFKIWLAKGIHVNGLLRAEATVDFLGKTHRGVLELEAHGTKAEKPPEPALRPRPPSGSAPPAPPPEAPPPEAPPPAPPAPPPEGGAH